MNLFEVDFYAHTLGSAAHVQVLLPAADPASLAAQGPARVYGAAPKAWPTLFLLHGMQGDETAWLRHSCVERYAAQAGVAVVLPALGNSFGFDLRYGLAYERYLSEELPAFLQASLPLDLAPGRPCVAGLSMGGFTALRLALRQPGRYAAAGSFSGALDPCELVQKRGEAAAAGAVEAPPEHLGQLAAAARQAGAALPAMYLACGLQDEICLGMNRRVRAQLQSAGCAVRYEEWAGGHEWAFWDTALQRFLRWRQGAPDPLA